MTKIKTKLRRRKMKVLASLLSLVLLPCTLQLVLVYRVTAATTTNKAVVNEAVIDPATGNIEGAGVATDDDETAATTKKKSPLLDLAYAQVDWMISEGGTFKRDKVVIRPENEDENDAGGNCSNEDENCSLAKNKERCSVSSSLGMYAADDIPSNSILMKIPRSIILAHGKFVAGIVLYCIVLHCIVVGGAQVGRSGA